MYLFCNLHTPKWHILHFWEVVGGGGIAIGRPLGVPCAKEEEEQINVVLFVA
jgi:hypothetical protein